MILQIMNISSRIFPFELQTNFCFVILFQKNYSYYYIFTLSCSHRAIVYVSEILTFFSKIFEKAISKYLLEFLDSNNTLYKYQFGFRKKYSTSHAIISIVEKINNALSSVKCVAGVFLDFRKAYDTVDHSILFKKLYAYGIRGTILNWFKSYLSNREQFASINSTYSDKNYISCGIPQGSVLGPFSS